MLDLCEDDVLSGLMEGGAEDFETGDDLYEAIGAMLLEVDGKGEDDIRDICNRLLEVMKRSGRILMKHSFFILDHQIQCSGSRTQGKNK